MTLYSDNKWWEWIKAGELDPKTVRRTLAKVPHGQDSQTYRRVYRKIEQEKK